MTMVYESCLLLLAQRHMHIMLRVEEEEHARVQGGRVHRSGAVLPSRLLAAAGRLQALTAMLLVAAIRTLTGQLQQLP